MSLADIVDARRVLKRFFAPTPLRPAAALSRMAGAEVFLKIESDLPTGSFKVRGATYALSRMLRDDRVTEVVASSTGNHGAAVAWAARQFEIPATIFLPEGANPVKRRRIEELGAHVVTDGIRDSTDASIAASEYARRKWAYFLHDATDAFVPAGTATIGCEILEQLSDVQTIIVPVGDSALIRGIASAVRPAVRVAGVQAEGAPAYCLSWRKGSVVETERCDTIADGLATRTPEPDNVAALRELVSDMSLVDDEEILDAIVFLANQEDLIAEPAAAAGVASLLKKRRAEGQKVAVVITGANISDEILSRARGAH